MENNSNQKQIQNMFVKSSGGSSLKNNEKNVFEVIRDLLYNSLGQAMIRIFQTKNLAIKFYLAIVSVSLVGLASYLTVESILSYLSYEVITTSRTLSETPTTFPKITLCNINMFTSKHASELIRQVNEMVLPSVSFFDKDQIKYLKNKQIGEIWQVINLAATALIFNKKYDDEYKKLLAHDFEDILISCQFNYKKCDASDFLWSFDPYYGNCYSFNTGFNSSDHQVALKESSIAGWLFGLSLELYVNFNESLNLFNDASGVILRIGNSSFLTDQNLDGLRIPSGFRTDVAINRAFNYIMPQPYSECLVDSSFRTYDSEIFNLILNSAYQYSQKLCLEQCFQRESLRYCNCTAAVFVSLFQNTRQCDNFEDIICGLKTFSEVYLVNNFIRDHCLPLCPLECNNSIYTASLSLNVIYGNKYINYIMQNPNVLDDFKSKTIDADAAKQSVSYINIYYDSLSYKLSYESPQMSVVSLLASIGGNLSLFLGVSVFSLSELIEIFIEIYFLKRTKNKSTKVENFSS